jgi:hypothetical protein
MPSKGPRTKRHQFECDDDLWAWVQQQAESSENSRTDVVVAALELARNAQQAQAARSSGGILLTWGAPTDVTTCARCGERIFRTSLDGRWHHPPSSAADHRATPALVQTQHSA